MSDRLAVGSPRLILPGVLSCYMVDDRRCIVEHGPHAGWTETFFYGLFLVPKSAVDRATWPEHSVLDHAKHPRLTEAARSVGWVAFTSRPRDVSCVRYTSSNHWFWAEGLGGVELFPNEGRVQIEGGRIGRIEDPAVDATEQELSLQRLVRALSGDRLTEPEARLASALARLGPDPDALAQWEARLDEIFAYAAIHADTTRQVAAALDPQQPIIHTSWATVHVKQFAAITIWESLHQDVKPAERIVLPPETLFWAQDVTPWEPATPMPTAKTLPTPSTRRMSTRDRLGWAAFVVFVAGSLFYLAR